MNAREKLLIATDLDATFLNHDYTWSEAAPAVARLRELGIPLVLNSSKTVAEMESLAKDLDLDSPIVAENGGCLRSVDNARAITIWRSLALPGTIFWEQLTGYGARLVTNLKALRTGRIKKLPSERDCRFPRRSERMHGWRRNRSSGTTRSRIGRHSVANLVGREFECSAAGVFGTSWAPSIKRMACDPP